MCVCVVSVCVSMYMYGHIHLNSHYSSLASLGFRVFFFSLSLLILDFLGLCLFLGVTISMFLDYNQTRRAFLAGKLPASDLPEFDPGVKSSGIQLSQ